MMKNGLWILCLKLLLAGTLILACSKESAEDVEFKGRREEYDLVVEGGINTFHRTQYIKLTRPSFHPDSLPKAINDAEVSVDDGIREVAFRLGSEPGVYSGIVQNQRYNRPYTLIVKYRGKEYRGTDTLVQVTSIVDDYIPFSISVRADNSSYINIPKHTFGFLNSSKWHISYKDQPVWNPAKFDSTAAYSYTHAFGAPNSLYPLLNQRRRDLVSPADYVTLFKFSLSDRYAKYLYSVFLETDWRGIFSGVPGRVEGNMSKGALGFFYVTDVDTRRYKVSELLQP